jgi:hypothetical protein
VDIYITDLANRMTIHPEAEVDLVAITVGDLINKAITDKGAIFYTHLLPSMIPTSDQSQSLTPLENVITIGYLGDYWDKVNNLPIFHSAVTASAPYIPFQGRKEFTIDTTEWYGASGSPVFIYNPAGWVDIRCHINNMGEGRLILLGIVYGVGLYNIDGVSEIVPVPTSLQVRSRIALPINVSICIDSQRIL